MMRCLVIHGPNLNLLGLREESIYGKSSLSEINEQLVKFGKELNFEVVARQSNYEGEIVTWIHEATNMADGLVLNAAAYTHTSIAIRDALLSVNIPAIEVHLSNTFSRESFRRASLISDVVKGRIEGFGWRGYLYGLQALSDLLN